MHGPMGGAIAGLLFVIPGALVMLALSLIYATLGAVPVIASLFFGLKSAVLILVVEAVLRIGRRALKTRFAWILAGTAFAALFFFNVPFPVVVLIAALIGTFAPGAFAAGAHGKAKDGPVALLDAVLDADPDRAQRFARSARAAGAISGALWLVPVVLLARGHGAYADVTWFFSKMAVVTFGGAYAVLAYVAQEAVQHYHWLSAPEMLTGLGLAETTPGPLILVLQFVGFLAGFRAPGPLSGISGGVTASALTLWVTFAPCFTFVFLGAPLIERLQNNRTLSGALPRMPCRDSVDLSSHNRGATGHLGGAELGQLGLRKHAICFAAPVRPLARIRNTRLEYRRHSHRPACRCTGRFGGACRVRT
jgi:chromate transporter